MPTKPEGPAQEPQRDSCVHCGLRIYQMSDGMFAGQWAHHGSNYRHCHSTNNAEDTATPAPSQPAGAREWLDAFLGKVPPYKFLSTVNESGRDALAGVLDAYAAQQTAAKDALLEQVKHKKAACGHLERYVYDRDLDGGDCAMCDLVAAERERVSLREFLESEIHDDHCECPLCRRIRKALKAGKDGQQ